MNYPTFSNLVRRLSLLFLLVSVFYTQTLNANQLRVGIEDFPTKTLDPAFATGFVELTLAVNLFESLVRYNSQSEVEPAQAQQWELSEDQRIWRFFLRDDIYWSDGEPVVAADFLLAMHRILFPVNHDFPTTTFILDQVVNAKEIKAGKAELDSLGVRTLDDKTLEFDLLAPTPYFLENLVLLFPVPSHLIDIETSGWADHTELVSNGSFTLQSRTDKLMTLARNPRYIRNADHRLDSIAFVFEDSERERTVALFRGQIDFATHMDQKQTDWLNDRGQEFSRKDILTGGIFYLLINTQDKFLNQASVRRIIAQAVNRQFISERLAGDTTVQAYSFTPVRDWPEVPQFWIEDREKASRLLEEAEFQETINIITPDNFEKIAVALRSMLDSIGIPVTVEVLSIVEWVNRIKKDDFMMTVGLWYGDYSDPLAYLSLLHSQASKNFTNWANNNYDLTLHNAQTELDPEARLSHLISLEEQLWNEVPIVPLVSPTHTIIISNKLQFKSAADYFFHQAYIDIFTFQ